MSVEGDAAFFKYVAYNIWFCLLYTGFLCLCMGQWITTVLCHMRWPSQRPRAKCKMLAVRIYARTSHGWPVFNWCRMMAGIVAIEAMWPIRTAERWTGSAGYRIQTYNRIFQVFFSNGYKFHSVLGRGVYFAYFQCGLFKPMTFFGRICILSPLTRSPTRSHFNHIISVIAFWLKMPLTRQNQANT